MRKKENTPKKQFLNGIYFGLGILFILGIVSVAVAVGFHTANEVLSGTFIGNYIFQNSVTIQDNLTVQNEFYVKNKNMTPTLTQTINFNNSMTRAQIQAKINSVGKYVPQGQTLTFQFADGTYNLDQSLLFTGFYGGGTIHIQGNIAEPNAFDLHTTQQVILDFSSGDRHGIQVNMNSNIVRIKNLKIKVKTDVSSYCGIYIAYSELYTEITNCYIEGTSTTIGLGILAHESFAVVQETYFSNVYVGLSTYYNKIHSVDNDDTGIMPKYGLYAHAGGQIIKYSAVQPNGSISNELTHYGGQIIGS